MLNNEGIKAVREAYDNHTTKTVAAKVFIKVWNLILTLINFAFFNSIGFLQIMGCTMGTICVPQHKHIFSRLNLKNSIYVFTSKINQYYTSLY